MSSNRRSSVDKLATANLSRDLERSDAFASMSLNSKYSLRASSISAQAVTGGDRIAPRAVLSSGAVSVAGTNSHTFRVVYSDRSGLNRRTIRTGNIQVTGPNRFSQIATLVGRVAFNRPGTRATATYRINAPGGTWDFLDNGAYRVSVLRNKVRDINRNPVRAGALGRGFQVNIPNPAPTAALGTSTLGSGDYTFRVNYSDDIAINAASIDGNDIQVTGPNGFSQFAQLVSVSPAGNGSPRTATYRVNSPTEFWTAANDGAYTISLVANQVSDNFGASVAAGSLGTFTIEAGRIPPSATLSASNVATAGATTYDFTVTYVDNEAVNVSTLGDGDVRVTGPNGFSQLATLVSVNPNSNGSPRTATYRITTPGGRWNGADSGTYTVSVEANQVSDAIGNFTAAGDIGTFAVTLEQTPATATLASAPRIALDSGSNLIAVTYADNAGVDITTLDNNDIRVTGPNGFNQLARFVRVEPVSNATSVTATYRLDAPGGSWDGAAAENGTYAIALQADQVSDVNGNAAAVTALGGFQVQMTPLRVEAETLTLSNYVTQATNFASGNSLIQLNTGSGLNATGTATTNFTGPSGIYDLVVRYLDENDGVSRIEVRVDGVLVGGWNLDKDLGSGTLAETNFAFQTISGVAINANSQIQITGQQVAPGQSLAGEGARIDYISFVPRVNGSGTTLPGALIGTTGDNTITATATTNTVDYSQLSAGIIANLATNSVLKPIYGGLATPKIMPLGDSLSLGEHAEQPNSPGAYRVQLYQRFVNDGLATGIFAPDFVGSGNQAAAPIPDKNHQITGTGTIDSNLDIVNTAAFTSFGTNVVLLMVGTVDTSNIAANNSPLETMQQDLLDLVNRITERLPNAEVLVASVPPVAGTSTQARIDQIQDYSELIPGIVGSVAAAGRNVRFVDVNGGLTQSDLLAGGVNLAASGHTKIGNLWYDALMDEDTLAGIENITGTAFSDIISGTNSDNRIEGGLGSDRLTGGTGADTFVYRSLTEGEDTITDFTTSDTIQISASGFGGGLVAGVSLANGTASATGTFVNGASPIGTGPNFLYNNGFLRYDPDGTGAQAAVTIATLTGSPALTAARISIVA